MELFSIRIRRTFQLVSTLLMENSYSLILTRIFITDFPATVRAAVIYQQQLEISKRLR